MSEIIEEPHTAEDYGGGMLGAVAAAIGNKMAEYAEGYEDVEAIARAAILATFEGMVPEGCAVSRDFVRTLEALKVVALEEKDAD